MFRAAYRSSSGVLIVFAASVCMTTKIANGQVQCHKGKKKGCQGNLTLVISAITA
jgi:hypothetical protein